eukprot:4675825-Pyramimonas_sp.AAC.1
MRRGARQTNWQAPASDRSRAPTALEPLRRADPDELQQTPPEDGQKCTSTACMREFRARAGARQDRV